MNRLKGLGVAPGRAAAPAHWLNRNISQVAEPAIPLAADQVRTMVSEKLKRDREAASSDILRDVLGAHMLIADDPELWRQIDGKASGGLALPDAIDATIKEIADQFEQMSDTYWRARADDIRDVGQQLLSAAKGQNPETYPKTLHNPQIVVADVLYPSDTAALPMDLIQGFILAQGSATSHVAILSRSLGIPAVIVGDAIHAITEGVDLYIDGDDGTVAINPDASLTVHRTPQKKWPLVMNTVATRDGASVHIEANIGSRADAEQARALGADGVGLLRTEFLFEGSRAPTEEEQSEVLKAIAETLEGRPLTVRLADIGGDKPLPYLNHPPEQNPFLGVRAIRLLRREPNLYDAQIRAILHVGQSFPLRMMFPMVASIQDWTLCQDTVARVMAGSQKSWHSVPMGCMVEVPAVVWSADELAQKVDFFSLGTNDLIQYLFAADRLSPDLADYYQPRHPAVLRAVKTVIDAADRQGIPVAMCGEMAGDPDNVEVLLGLGLRTFSMTPQRVPEIKNRIADLDLSHCREVASRYLTG